MGRFKQKRFLRTCAKCQDSDYLAHAQSIVQYCIMFILDNEGADQTARIRRLNWVCTVSIYPDMFSHGGAQILSVLNSRQYNKLGGNSREMSSLSWDDTLQNCICLLFEKRSVIN